MPDITVVGANLTATWGWEISLYLFLGGLVAGLMVFGGALRYARPMNFPRSLFVADVAGLPLLAVGMLFLFIDLSNKINVWRLYTTFQPQSPMSWGAWILLVTMVYLALRFVARVPTPYATNLLGMRWFYVPPADEEEGEGKKAYKPSRAESIAEWIWTMLDKIAVWTRRREAILNPLGIVLGICLGFYTGVLLSTIPSRPLWNTALLAPLFLVSALASGGAFLCLFLPHEEHQRLIPYSLLSCAVEMLLLLALVINLGTGSRAVQRAGTVLLTGGFGWAFWGLIFLLGLLVPATLEQLERTHVRLPLVPARVPPVLKLVGSLSLRVVIVYAGILSFL